MFQGSPISAMLFVIYFDHLLERYRIKLLGNFATAQPMITVRNEQAEYKWCRAKEIANHRTKGEKRIRNPVLKETWVKDLPNDTHITQK